jgi:hypothetical protein
MLRSDCLVSVPDQKSSFKVPWWHLRRLFEFLFIFWCLQKPRKYCMCICFPSCFLGHFFLVSLECLGIILIIFEVPVGLINVRVENKVSFTTLFLYLAP